MRETRQETLARCASRCETCGAGPATGLELPLLCVHHRNGDHADDRPENRVILCASCHTRHHGETRAPRPSVYSQKKLIGLRDEDGALLAALAHLWRSNESETFRRALREAAGRYSGEQA